MQLPNSLTKVTTFSKILAMVLFVTLPFTGFFLGYQYRKATTIPKVKEIVAKPLEKTIVTPGSSKTGFTIKGSISNPGWKTLIHDLGFSFDFPTGKNYEFENRQSHSPDSLLYLRIYTDVENPFGGPFIEISVYEDNEPLKDSSGGWEEKPKEVNINDIAFQEYTALGEGSPHGFQTIRNDLTFVFSEIFGPLSEFDKVVNSVNFHK